MFVFPEFIACTCINYIFHYFGCLLCLSAWIPGLEMCDPPHPPHPPPPPPRNKEKSEREKEVRLWIMLNKIHQSYSIGFPAHFRHLFIPKKKKRKMCSQFRPGQSGMCECSFQFRLWAINFETLSFNFFLCHPFSSIAINSNSSVTVSWAGDSKLVKVSLKNSLPDIPYDKIMNLFCFLMTNLIL